MTIEVGKKYLSDRGVVVTIILQDSYDVADCMPFAGDDNFWYSKDGVAYGVHRNVIVRLVSEVVE